MPFDRPPLPQDGRVAVIGGGVSGLGAAYALSKSARVVLFEAEPRLGGHARTVEAGDGVAVDTGFIVFNERNYPNLCGLFDAIGAPSEPSDMSFAASIAGGRVEYALRDLDRLYAQRRNLLRPAFHGMVRDILRFNRLAPLALERPDMTLEALFDEIGVGEAFRRWYAMPFSSAIWSATPGEMAGFPAASFVRFFQNHGLLAREGQPQWRTVTGGSRVYVEKLAAAIRAAGGEIRAGAPVEAVFQAGGPRVRAKGGEMEPFDAVIVAAHADQALAMLADPTPGQCEALGGFRYSRNRAVLHSDPRLMPKRQRCWSSWNYIGDGAADPSGVAVTYWMNRLQNLKTDRDVFVTLNPTRPVPEDLIHDETEFHHPIFDMAALEGQRRLPEAQGENGIWFAGAYARFGFHEDGLASGLAAARALGGVPSWA